MIAEDTREERFRKLTILGLYGITPHVQIVIQDITKPLGPLTFILFGSGGEGKYRTRPRIVSEQGEELIQAPPIEIDIEPRPSGSQNLILHIQMVRFPREGLYRFIVEADGESQYETTFLVRPGRPEEFQ